MKYIDFFLRAFIIFFLLFCLSFVFIFIWILNPKQMFKDIKYIFLDVFYFLKDDHPF
jgi:hypothetical protein